MKKTLLTALALLATGTAALASALGTTPAGQLASQRLSLQTWQKADISSFAPARHFGARQQQSASLLSTEQPVAQMQTSDGWGYLYDENELPCYYTIETQTSGSYYYSGAKVEIWDNDHEQIATIQVDVPDSITVNRITPYGDLTTSFFDGKSSTRKVAVELHAVGNASNGYRGRYFTYIYSLDGTLVATYEGMGMFASVGSGWQRTTRFVLTNSLFSTDAETGDETETLVYQILKGGYGGASVEHTFTFDASLCYYSDASPLQIYDIDDKLHFAVCKYDKPYSCGSDSIGFPLVTPDNHYTVTTYDNRYNLVDSIAVDFTAPEGVNFRMVEFGSLGFNDLSKNYFSQTGNFDYVVAYADYNTSSSDDGYIYSFSVYNSEGQKTHDICSDVVNTWSLLADVKGQSDQMVFMQDLSGTQQQQAVDLPSCEKATLLPADIDGYTVTTTLNRYPVGDSYEYLIKVSTADTDDEGNVIAPIAWVNPKDLTVSRVTKFNLGPDAEYFLPYLYDGAMNPYVFNTDDKLEFLYIAKVKKADGSGLEKVLVVGNEDGEILRTFSPDSETGQLSVAALNLDNPLRPELEIVSVNDDEQTTRQFYSLPFTAFEAGGDGSKSNPYLIQTVGDLRNVAFHTDANYRVVADLDFSVDPRAWSPIDGFAGSLDGQGHVLANLYLDTDATEAGLFSTVAENATISNLVIASPTVVANEKNTSVGVLAASCVSDSIYNVHVLDAQIAGDETDGCVGGLVGEASLYSTLTACSFSGTINTPAANGVGGIAGKLGTSTELRACTSSGDLTAQSAVGGIAGDLGYMPSSISNCHSSANLTAQYSIGGIAGSTDGRSSISHSYATGKLTANYQGGWNEMAVGGIIGYLASKWETKKDTIVSNCIATTTFDLPTDAAITALDGFATAHRIAGRTIADEEWMEGETPRTEEGLLQNFSTMTVIAGESVSSDDDTSVEGKDVAATALTDDFSLEQGYQHGTWWLEPWKQTEGGLPVLYYEHQPLALSLDHTQLTLVEGSTATLTATLYGISADDVMTFSTTDDAVATVEESSNADGTLVLSVSAKTAGEQKVTVSAGSLEAVCLVTVIDEATAGIHTAVAEGKLAILVEGQQLKAEGAQSLSLYSLDGRLVQRLQSDRVSLAQLQGGVYIVEALSAQGQRTAAKIVVK